MYLKERFLPKGVLMEPNERGEVSRKEVKVSEQSSNAPKREDRGEREEKTKECG